MAVLLGGALVGAVQQSLERPAPGSSSGAAWGRLWGDPMFRDALAFSARIALEATALSAALALGLALALRRRGAALRWLALLPVPVPHLLVAVTAVTWLAPGGLAERIIGRLPLTLVRDRAGLGVVLVYTWKETPFLLLLLLASLSPALAAREEAAATLGAGPLARLRWILWPALLGPLAAGALIVAAFAFGAFEIPLTVGPTYPPTIATYALQALQQDVIGGRPTASAALLVAACVSGLLAVPTVRLLRRTHG